MIAEGTPLQAGDVVMSGALGPMGELAPDSTVRADIECLGTVSVSRHREVGR
jgi:2-keto-4-pentenoate hydratase